MMRWFSCELMTVSDILTALPVPEILTVAGALLFMPVYPISRHLGVFCE